MAALDKELNTIARAIWWDTAKASRTLGFSLAPNAYWMLNEASGNRAALLGSGNLLQTGTVPSAVGVFGTAADFPASGSNYLSLATNADIEVGSSFAIEGWIYANSISGTPYLVIKGSRPEYLIFIDTGKLKLLSLGTVTYWVADSGSAISTGIWYHFAAVVDVVAATAKMYINGVLTNTGSGYPGTSFTGSGTLYLGQDTSGGNQFNGRIGPLGIWQRVLTGPEILSLYHMGYPADELGIICKEVWNNA